MLDTAGLELSVLDYLSPEPSASQPVASVAVPAGWGGSGDLAGPDLDIFKEEQLSRLVLKQSVFRH